MEDVILDKTERNKDEIFKLYSEYADYFEDIQNDFEKPQSEVKRKTIPKSLNKTCYNYYMISKAKSREASKDKKKSKQTVFKISKDNEDNNDGESEPEYVKNESNKKRRRYK